MKKIFGNPFGQVLLLLAEIAGLVGSVYLAIQSLILCKDLGGMFGSLKGIMSFGTLFLPAIFLLVALIGTIVGLAAKKRGVGIMSVIFVLVALLAQALCFVVGYYDLGTYFTSLEWSKMMDWGLNLVAFGYMVSIIGFIFAIVAISCAGGKAKGPAILFAVLALICYLFGAFGYLFPLFRDKIGESFEILATFANASIASIGVFDYVMFIVRGVFIVLVGLAVFVLVFEKYADKEEAVAVEEKAEVAVVGADAKHAAPEKKEEKSTAGVTVIDKKDTAPDADVYKYKDRIIIEIR